jgi:hypothetical protein
MLAGNRDDVSSGRASAICEGNRLAEPHGEAVVLGKAMRALTDRNLDPSPRGAPWSEHAGMH